MLFSHCSKDWNGVEKNRIPNIFREYYLTMAIHTVSFNDTEVEKNKEIFLQLSCLANYNVDLWAFSEQM